ncbi:MAG: OPT/YSL family transporter [Pirellulales bacterium]|nr:OPT/YSL family transporter [Pirellulales bacterium]
MVALHEPIVYNCGSAPREAADSCQPIFRDNNETGKRGIPVAIKQLTDQQIREWTVEQKDRWWFENVWRGDMPQLTLRSALTGMIIGGVLSLTNLYVGAKTGWTLGVGITSVILAFAMFKVLSQIGLAKEFTILENNCMQSIATAAGYMSAPMISSLAAYMMITGEVIPMWVTAVWIVAIAGLGVLFAFPLKRRFINDEQHPFPEGRAAGIVMDALHTGDARDGLFKAKLLVVCGGASALIKLMSSKAIMAKLWLGAIALPEYLDEWIYRFVTPRLSGAELRQLTISVESDPVAFAMGGLMGIRTGVSLLIGALVNYFIIAPWMIRRGDIVPILEEGVQVFTFKQVVVWALWGGVAMMTTSSLFAFFSKPKVLMSAFTGLFSRRSSGETDLLRPIELPMRVFVIGIPLVGGIVVLLAHYFFGVKIIYGVIAIPLIFVFSLIGVNSTALTSITPTGALSQLTQLTFGAIAPGKITTNIATASITAEVASNASNLLMDIKPGYMLGAKPRQQAIGHVLGILAGVLISVPVFYLVFLGDGPEHLTSKEPMPSATVWKGVAELLTKGISQLSVSAQWAALVGAILGLTLESLRLITKGRFWISGVAVGLATVIPFSTCLAMFLGAFFFWVAGKVCTNPETSANRILVQNQEPICAGVIAGGALMGITVMMIKTFFL